VFWIFAVIAAVFAFKRTRPERAISGLTRADAVLALAAVILVRVFATGIRLAH
jgi:hypothetical protein